jgi:hypothetical protein
VKHEAVHSLRKKQAFNFMITLVKALLPAALFRKAPLNRGQPQQKGFEASGGLSRKEGLVQETAVSSEAAEPSLGMQHFFEKVVGPCIVGNHYTDICEIGVKHCANTERLLLIQGLKLYLIDPCRDTNLVEKYKNAENIRVFKGLSLNILPEIPCRFDCVIIDGDHNWYTVFNELRFIEKRKLLRDGGTVFLHDVGWPYGRRDLYHTPESIPKEFRHPYAKSGEWVREIYRSQGRDPVQRSLLSLFGKPAVGSGEDQLLHQEKIDARHRGTFGIWKKHARKSDYEIL